MVVSSVTNYYFRIENPPDPIEITYFESVLTYNVNLYIQIERNKGDLAGDLNVNYDGTNKSLSKLVTNS